MDSNAPSLRELFAPPSRRRCYLEVEAALAEAEAELDVIPAEAGAVIARAAREGGLDDARIAANFAATGHSMMALVEELARVCGPHGAWVHWGATTQNIQQTGDVLILRDAHRVLSSYLRGVLRVLADLGERTAEMPMPGRTHWQHAVPITFGLKVAAWADQMVRHDERLRELEPRLLTSMTGGAAGTFASFGPVGAQVQDGVALRLGLTAMPVPSRAIVDHFTELVCVLGMLCATAQSIAEEVERLMTPEYGEVSEAIPAGDVGSSTMPQKRNPKLCGAVIIPAAQVRHLVPVALEAILQAHEVDGTRSVLIDRAVEQACVLSGDALQALHSLLADLEVFPAKMAANMDLTGGLITAEAVMLDLARTLGRQSAHHIVHDIATHVATTPDTRFDEALLAHPAVSASVDPDRIRTLIDASSYLGLSADVAREAAHRARSAAQRDVRGEPL